MAEHPTHPPGGPSTDAPASPSPAVDLGPSFEPVAFAAGRYALVIRRRRMGTHAMNVVKEASTASLVLELAADGSATACRGWRHQMFNDGPSVHTVENFREQQGFRGHYVVRDSEVDVELTADDTVCAPVRKHGGMVPRRSSTMKLRCVLAAPRSHASLSAPVLLCEWNDANTAEVAAYQVDGVVPGRWMVLGSGKGVRISVSGAPLGTEGDPVAVVVEPASEPIEYDAWERRERSPAKAP